MGDSTPNMVTKKVNKAKEFFSRLCPIFGVLGYMILDDRMFQVFQLL